MSILCKIGLHKWRYDLKEKETISFGYHYCRTCIKCGRHEARSSHLIKKGDYMHYQLDARPVKCRDYEGVLKYLQEEIEADILDDRKRKITEGRDRERCKHHGGIE